MPNSILERNFLDLTFYTTAIGPDSVNVSNGAGLGIDQTVQNSGIASIVLYNPTDNNFYAMPLSHPYAEGDQIVGVLR
jgi:hypothetical protein